MHREKIVGESHHGRFVVPFNIPIEDTHVLRKTRVPGTRVNIQYKERTPSVIKPHNFMRSV